MKPYAIAFDCHLKYTRPDYGTNNRFRKTIDVKMNVTIRANMKSKRDAMSKSKVQFELQCRLKAILSMDFENAEVLKITSVFPADSVTNGIYINGVYKTRENQGFVTATEEYLETRKEHFDI